MTMEAIAAIDAVSAPGARAAQAIDPVATYDAPLPPAAQGGDFKPMIDYAVKVNDEFRAALVQTRQPVPDDVLAQMGPDQQYMMASLQRLADLSFTQTHYTEIAKLVDIALTDIKVLYQQLA